MHVFICISNTYVPCGQLLGVPHLSSRNPKEWAMTFTARTKLEQRRHVRFPLQFKVRVSIGTWCNPLSDDWEENTYPSTYVSRVGTTSTSQGQQWMTYFQHHRQFPGRALINIMSASSESIFLCSTFLLYVRLPESLNLLDLALAVGQNKYPSLLLWMLFFFM